MYKSLFFVLSSMLLPTFLGAQAKHFLQEEAAWHFLENKGQITDQHQQPRRDIQYKIPAGKGLNIFLGTGTLYYVWAKQSGYDPSLEAAHHGLVAGTPAAGQPAFDLYRLEVSLIGANQQAPVIASEGRGYYERYYLPGLPASGAQTRSYRKLLYRDVYPHIDWVLYFNAEGLLEHDFVVRPGGNVSDIRMRYRGASRIALLPDGSLSVATPMGTVRERAPYSYDEQGKPVGSRFVLEGDVLSFAVDDYSGTLIIDPTIEWSSYLGGQGSDMAYGLCRDGSGALYMAGVTASVDNMVTTGSYQQSIAGNTDAFVSKFSPSGILLWSTYYGGSAADRATDICFDTVGQALYVVGATQSNSGIATAGAHQFVHGGNYDVFLARFDTAGQRQWATYYGGSSTDGSGLVAGVATDALGRVYICSETNSTGSIASAGSQQPAKSGSRDGFLAQFSSDGQRLWGTYLGGNGGDFVRKLACDALGNVYVGGHTGSSSGIASSGAHQAALAGGNDVFLAKYSPQGVQEWCTYFGGSAAEVFNALAVNSAGQVFIGGSTQSAGGIAGSNASQGTIGGGYDGFLACFTTQGALAWSTYLGGEANDNVNALALEGSSLYVGGGTASTTGMAQGDALYSAFGGGTLDGFLARFDSSGTKNYATYIGSTDADEVNAICPGALHSVYLGGRTNSAAGMATANSHQEAFGGGDFDALLMKLSFCTPPPPVAGIQGDTVVCAGQSYEYDVDSVRTAEHYIWQLPEGWQGASDSTRIQLIPGKESGPISVAVRSDCAVSDTVRLGIRVSPLPRPEIQAQGLVLRTVLPYRSYQWLFNGEIIAGATEGTLLAEKEGAYSVRVTNADGCEGLSDTVTVQGSAIADWTKDTAGIRLYPNPAQDVLHIAATLPLGRMVITGMDGRVMLSVEAKDIVDISSLDAGLYAVALYAEDGRLVLLRKVVVLR